MSGGPAVVFQCCACRALGSAVDVVVAADGSRAGLVCPLCRFTSWLPAAGISSTYADDTAPAASSTASAPPPLLMVGAAHSAMPPASMPAIDMSPLSSSSSLAPSNETAAVVPGLALVPAPAPPRALQPSFDADTTARIQARLRLLPEASADQLHLRERFDELLSTSWTHELTHKQLLKSASMAGELAFVGARYRAVLDVIRDEPRARAAQQELLTLAMVTMQQTKELGSLSPGGLLDGSGESRRTAKLVGAVLLLVAILVGGVFLVRTIRSTFARMEAVDR